MNGFEWAAFARNLAPAAGAALFVMAVTFAVALRTGLRRIVDVAWGIGFTAVALVSYVMSAGDGDPGRRLLVTVLTAVWGLRLALHIARRGRGHGEDPRYEALLARARGNRGLYALRVVYLLQGALVWLVSLPVQAAHSTAHDPCPPSRWPEPRSGRWASSSRRSVTISSPASSPTRPTGKRHGPRSVEPHTAPELLR